MGVRIIAELPVKPESVSDMKSLMKEILPDTRAFDGCNKVDVYSNKAIRFALKHCNGWHSVGLIPKEILQKVDYIKSISNEYKNELEISTRKNFQITQKKVDYKKEVLRGTSDKIIEGLEEYMNAGVSHIVFQILGSNLNEIIKSMEAFSVKIKPQLSK